MLLDLDFGLQPRIDYEMEINGLYVLITGSSRILESVALDIFTLLITVVRIFL